MSQIPLLLRWLLCAGYAVLGGYVLTKQVFPSYLLNQAFGLIAIAYGIFRGYRAWKDYRQGTDETEKEL